MNYKPFGYGVLLQEPAKVEKTAAGVIKSDQVMQEEQAENAWWKVVAAGAECKFALPGMEVKVSGHAVAMMSKLRLGGRDYYQIDESALLGKKEKSPIKPSLN